MKRRAIVGVAVVLLGLASASAQSWGMDWFTIDSGGGTSAGGAYSLSGTIGQPDTGTMAGEDFVLVGGFWPGAVAIPPPEAPGLFIELEADSETITWEPADGGFVLEQSADLPAAAWAPAPSGNPVTIPVQEQRSFYRLRSP